jgi:hypothetical protein
LKRSQAIEPSDCIDEAITALDEALTCAETEEHYYEAELHRLRGELLLVGPIPIGKAPSDASARQSLSPAARAQSRGSCAPRPAWRVCCAKPITAMRRVRGSRIFYNWFTEGFETLDLKDAKALLDELRN